MALSQEIVSSRLRETFGNESQENIAKKLNMTQGNVSKLLSGNQLPALDTLYSISEQYEVSVDWILGISNQKRIQTDYTNAVYSTATEVVTNLFQRGTMVSSSHSPVSMELTITDPLLIFLINKSRKLYTTDLNIFVDWKDSKLSSFDKWPFVYAGIWNNGNVSVLASEASSEPDWLDVLDIADATEKEYSQFYGCNDGPFNNNR